MKRAILIVLLLGLIPLSAFSRTWYIKDDGTGDAPSISAGIDSCAVGDTVLVAAGTYSPTAMIYIGSGAADSIFVISESGPSNTIVDCAGTALGFAVEGRYSTYLLIDGFDIRNAGVAIGINLSAGGQIVVENNIIHSNPGHGISIDQSSEVIVRNNLIYSNHTGVSCLESSDIEIIGNTIGYHVGSQAMGIIIDTYPWCTVQNNIICNKTSLILWSPSSTVFECNNLYNNENNLASYIGVDGNFATDPEFCSQTPEIDGNFYLQSDSPCIPGNHPDGNSCGLIGYRPAGCGTTGTEERSWGTIKKLMKPSSKSR